MIASAAGARRSTPPARIKLVERRQDVRDDQDDDRRRQPCRAAGVDDVGQRMGGFDYDENAQAFSVPTAPD